jgi:ABC-2 type transport system permease protein
VSQTAQRPAAAAATTAAATTGAARPGSLVWRRPVFAPPGSLLWLAGHDLRLIGRDFRASGRGRRRSVATTFLVTVLLMHLIGYLSAPEMARIHDELRAEALLTGSFALGGAFMLFLSKAISEATDALFQRGDLDLLLSSPLPMRRVLATRLCAIAVISGFLPLLLIVPMINGMVLRGYFAWAGTYPVLVSLSLLAAATGSALTFSLLASVGPRWTQLAARALATLFGAISFLSAEARLIVPPPVREAVWQAMVPTPGVVPMGPQWWPARAVLGDALPIVAMLAVAAAAVAVVSAGLGEAYGAGVVNALARPRATIAGGVEGRFGSGVFVALLRKEWRLFRRHPGLGTQIFYQFVFLVPGAWALMGLDQYAGESAAAVVFLTAMMTGRITKILMAGPYESDDAPALAATSPVPVVLVERAKVLVTGAALLVIGGLPILGIALKMPSAFPAAFLSCVAATATRMWLAMHRAKPMRRAGLQGRLAGGADGFLGAAIDFGWGAAGGLATLFL